MQQIVSFNKIFYIILQQTLQGSAFCIVVCKCLLGWDWHRFLLHFCVWVARIMVGLSIAAKKLNTNSTAPWKQTLLQLIELENNLINNNWIEWSNRCFTVLTYCNTPSLNTSWKSISLTNHTTSKQFQPTPLKLTHSIFYTKQCTPFLVCVHGLIYDHFWFKICFFSFSFVKTWVWWSPNSGPPNSTYYLQRHHRWKGH